MFVHNLVIDAIEQRKLISEQLKECRREETLLRNKIEELKEIAGNKIREELKKNTLYIKLSTIREDLYKQRKDVQYQYIHWRYTCNGDNEGWDFDWCDSEKQKLLTPLYESIISTEMVCADIQNHIYEQVRQKYFTEFNKESQTLVALENKEKQLTEYQKECYNTMCKALQPVLDVYVPLINDIFEKLGVSTKDLTPIICPSFLEKGVWKISFCYDLPFSHTEEVDEEDFDTDGLNVKIGLHIKTERFVDELAYLCEESIPGLVDANVEYNEDDVEINGSTYHNKGYYDYDTGCGEPEGDFYYGDVTASTTIKIKIVII